jgi:acyl-coenzyme A thioesterase PaaI-like protein
VAKSHDSPGETLKKAWDRLHKVPGGRWLFSKVVGWTAPYTGSIRAKVLELEPGFVRMQLKDRRSVRNHLNCVHAIALVNLGEVTSGLAMLTALPKGVRGIVTGLSIEYIKKARGTLIAESRVSPPTDITETVDFDIVADIKNQAGEIVSKAHITWRLSPARSQERHASPAPTAEAAKA